MIMLFFLVALTVFSLLSAILSLVLIYSREVFMHIEERLGFEIISARQFSLLLEGQVNFVNDWVIKNRLIFGPIFFVLAINNAWRVYFIIFDFV